MILTSRLEVFAEKVKQNPEKKKKISCRVRKAFRKLFRKAFRL